MHPAFKAFLFVTALIFWVDFVLDQYPPQRCSEGFISIGAADRYLCVVGHDLRDDPRNKAQ